MDNCLKDIDRDNFNTVSVMVCLDVIDEEESKRLLEEACYCIANLKKEINKHLGVERDVLEAFNRRWPEESETSGFDSHPPLSDPH